MTNVMKTPKNPVKNDFGVTVNAYARDKTGTNYSSQGGFAWPFPCESEVLNMFCEYQK